MAEGDYQQASRQQRRIAQQYLNAHPELKNTDITTLSTQEFGFIKAMHLEANETDHILGPTEKQLMQAEQYLKAHPELNTTFEQLSDKEIEVISPTHRDSQTIVQTPEVANVQQPELSAKGPMTQKDALNKIRQIFSDSGTELSAADTTKATEVLHRINALEGVIPIAITNTVY